MRPHPQQQLYQSPQINNLYYMKKWFSMEKFLLASVVTAIGILTSHQVAVARLNNPFTNIGSLTVTDLTFTNATGTNLNIITLSSSTQLKVAAGSASDPAIYNVKNGAGIHLPTNGVALVDAQGTASILVNDALGVTLTGGSGSKIFLGGTSPYFRPSGSTGLGLHDNLSATIGVGLFFRTEDPRTGTSGTSTIAQFGGTLAPTAGTGSFIGLDVTPTVSTTGSYNGNYIAALRVSPLVTSATSSNFYLFDIGTNTLANGTGQHTSVFSVNATGSLALGINPANIGQLRLPNAQDINSRNAANTADLRLIGSNSANQTLIGNTVGASLFGSDVGFSTDNTFDIGGGTRNPRHISLEGTMNVNTNTIATVATLVVQGDGARNPFSVVTNTAAAGSMFTILTNGNVGINSSSPVTTLAVQGSLTQSAVKSCTTGVQTDVEGTFSACVASDERLKVKGKRMENLTNKELDNIFNNLSALYYKWKPETKRDSQNHAGFVAQEVQKFFPEAVVPAGNGMLGVDPNAILALTQEKVKRMDARLEALENSIVVKYSFWDWVKSLFK